MKHFNDLGIQQVDDRKRFSRPQGAVWDVIRFEIVTEFANSKKQSQ